MKEKNYAIHIIIITNTKVFCYGSSLSALSEDDELDISFSSLRHASIEEIG